MQQPRATLFLAILGDFTVSHSLMKFIKECLVGSAAPPCTEEKKKKTPWRICALQVLRHQDDRSNRGPFEASSAKKKLIILNSYPWMRDALGDTAQLLIFKT